LTTRLIAAAQDVLSENSHYALDTAGTIELQQDQAIGGLSGTGRIEMAGNELDLFQGDFNRDFSGVITGGGLVRKYGDGRLRLGSNNAAYDGSFIAGGGILDVTGDYSGTDVLVSQGTLTGSGSVGDVSVSVGTLAGRSAQTLTMASLGMTQSSTISVALGIPGARPLFHVLGDVRLDGFIDIENAGGFGPGVYRIMDYDGALDYRGLIIDRLPNGVDEDEIELQLAVANQLNIVSTAAASGPALFWDGGDAALWNNGAIDGGSGIWRVGTRSFTTADGNNNNTMYPKPGFAIFQGQGGEVTVDNTTGDSQVTGMQFAADGYILDGDAITLEEDETIVRVGDGTTEGADYVTIINNVLNGNGGLIKTDLGTLVLNSNDNEYVRDTEVRGGTLEVNGSIGDVLVGQDGRLQGSGAVGNAEVLGTIAAGSLYPPFGSLAPTPGMGTLLITGDLILSDTSIFELKVDAAGNNDLVEVDGTAYLDGRLVTLASGGDYADATEYTFLRAEGGVEGTFDGVTANLAFLDAALTYNANDVRLTLSRNGVTFGNVGTTANQLATGVATETLGAGNAVYDRLLTLSAEDARAGLDQLSGEIHASAKAALLSAGQAVTGTMEDRVAAAFAQLGQAGQDTASGLNFWTQAGGSIGVLEANGNAAASNFGAGNLFVGADAMFNQKWMFGAMVGYGATSTTSTDRSSTATSDNYHVGLYGGGEVEDFTFKFGAGYTQHDIHTTRSVTMPGFAEQLFSSRSGGTGQIFGEVGHKFAFDSGLVVEPFVNLAHASLFTGGFAETGGAAAVSGGASHASTTHLTLGVRGETDLTIGELEVTARGMIGWRHALGTVDPTSTHAFGNGTAFTVTGSPVARDTAIVEAGLDFNISPNVELGIGYDGQFGSGMQHGIKTNLSVKF
ncbi:MAG: autotransporter domain-containing protein, partial [Devosia sp.]